MDRQTARRTSWARIIGITAIVTVYAVALVWAADLNAAGAAGVTVAAAEAASRAAAQAPEQLNFTAGAVGQTTREAPLATLGIAAALALGSAAWYGVHAIRGRGRGLIARRARLVVRQITALM